MPKDMKYGNTAMSNKAEKSMKMGSKMFPANEKAHKKVTSKLSKG